MGVGMFVPTFVLALTARTARGLGTPVQVSIAGYPDPDFPANKLRVGRNRIEQNVVFLDT
jgi:hypothetical protein